jgi:hypothetical protein
VTDLVDLARDTKYLILLLKLRRLLRDRGISLADGAQARIAPHWRELAYEAIVEVARQQDTVHVDDVLRSFPFRPEHHNAWGAVWMRAIRNRVIASTGTIRPCTIDPGKHRHNSPVYRSLIYGRAK